MRIAVPLNATAPRQIGPSANATVPWAGIALPLVTYDPRARRPVRAAAVGRMEDDGRRHLMLGSNVVIVTHYRPESTGCVAPCRTVARGPRRQRLTGTATPVASAWLSRRVRPQSAVIVADMPRMKWFSTPPAAVVLSMLQNMT